MLKTTAPNRVAPTPSQIHQLCVWEPRLVRMLTPAGTPLASLNANQRGARNSLIAMAATNDGTVQHGSCEGNDRERAVLATLSSRFTLDACAGNT